jgi:IS1 family transposase
MTEVLQRRNLRELLRLAAVMEVQWVTDNVPAYRMLWRR